MSIKINLSWKYLWIVGVCCCQIALAQLTPADYEAADKAAGLGRLAYRNRVNPVWLSDQLFWYEVNAKEGPEYWLVNAATDVKQPLFDQGALAKLLSDSLGVEKKGNELGLRRLSVSEDAATIRFNMDGFDWSYEPAAAKLSRKPETKQPERERRYWAEARDELSNDPVVSPDGEWTAYIQEYNVYVKNNSTGEATVLSYDGAEGEHYSSFLAWSPDSKKIATYQVRPSAKRFFYFVESSPVDQLQPKLHTREYLKPGDAVTIRKPALFDVEAMKQITVDASEYMNQFELGWIEWAADSKAFYFDYNQRGHQRFDVVRVDAGTGALKSIISETSDKCVEYINLRRERIDATNEIIWKSQRDGWYHLYLIDAVTGKIKNQITKGEWVVREIIHVDGNTGMIYFTAGGKNKGEDPYHIHYYSVNKDGSGLKELTPENAEHKAWFSPEYTYMLDQYSRVDQEPVFVLRQAKNGKIIKKLEQTDISEMLEAGWKKPEVFTSKGRDGKTDIWGIIYRPTNFDPNKTYPIVEYIYAGPGTNYVPKSFTPNFWYSGLAELGFVVVQIDGMGTGNRSRAFAEVSYQNLKDAGFPDRIPWIKAAAQKYPYMDINNVGLYGGSAGGQSTVCGVLQYPEFYKAGVAACGCYDNRMDKIWWNELWMGYPMGEHYIENSVVENADKLNAELMLILGEMDDNVDPASTMQLVDALIKADKEFELVVLPGLNHTLGGKYGERKRRDFFIRHLKQMDAPKWNKEN